MKKIRIWYEVIRVQDFPVIKSQIRLGDLVYVFDSVWWNRYENGNKRHNIRGTLIQEGLRVNYKTHCKTTIKPKKYVMVEVRWLMEGLKKNDCMWDLEKELYEWLENYVDKKAVESLSAEITERTL
jgi:hypothetical protein